MAKDIFNRRIERGNSLRERARHIYRNRYFNLFMSAYKFKGISNEQQDFILRKMWSLGSIGAFIVEGTLPSDAIPESVNQYPNGVIAFTTFAPVEFNIYDWPIKVNLIQYRGAKFIPTSIQIVNKDVVIGFAQRNKKPVCEIVDFFIDKIVDVDMTIQMQLKAHKVPYLISCTPENEATLKNLMHKLENDDGEIYLSSSEVDAIKTLQTGNTYIIDKLFNYKTALENELLTYLGIDNVGVMEKKEHLDVDEVNSNNDLINDNSDNFLKSLEEFCERINTYLNYEISVEATSSPVVAERETESKDIEEEEDMEDVA